MLSRRRFATSLVSAPIALTAACQTVPFLTPNSTARRSISKVGLQTYTLRTLFEQDAEKTLRLIKETGYDYVELNRRNFAQIEPADLKAMLDDIGLGSPASHISFDMITDDIAPLIKTAKTLELKYVIVPWMDETLRGLEDWKSHAALMNIVGKRLADEGIRLAYHNHEFEFDDLGGKTTAMDVLLNDTRPENLDFELDLFWAALADADIPALFRAHPGRFKLCHIKDMGSNKHEFVGKDRDRVTADLMKNVGEGVLPFESYFALNNISGMEYFVAEHDNPKQPYRDSIATSYKSIKEFRF